MHPSHADLGYGLVLAGTLVLMALGGVLYTSVMRLRKRLGLLARRLGQICSGEARARAETIGRLSHRMVLFDELIDELEHEIGSLERDRGYEEPAAAFFISFFPNRRLNQLDQRLERLEEVAGP